jgi:hypothetical protein
MESATVDRSMLRSLGVMSRLRALPSDLVAFWAFCGVTVLAVIGFFVRPTYPNYDTYYALLWGREITHLHLPSFEAYRAPTEHPLAIAFGAFMSLFGESADRLVVLITLFALVALAAGTYRLARLCFTPLVGAIAASVTRDPRIHRHPVHGDGRLGRRARGRAPAQGTAGLSPARGSGALAAGRLATGRRVLPLDELGRDLA